jgi:threonine/homoserine/homoserine lactone efflux protein
LVNKKSKLHEIVPGSQVFLTLQMHWLIVFWSGCLLSFLGQLPLGTMSITATQIAVQESVSVAWKYALGVTLVEMVYLRIVLAGMNLLMRYEIIFSIMSWLTAVVFLILGILCIKHTKTRPDNKKTLMLGFSIDRFLLGLTMSALNPAQIPFWFIWSGYFMDMHWLSSSFVEFNWFTLGAGLGTLLGLWLYIVGGNWLVVKMKASTRQLNNAIGIIFIVAAIIQFYRLFAKSGLAGS